MHTARLIFNDGVETALPVAPEQTLLDAALACDAPLRYDCCSGECGSCVMQLLEGRIVGDAGSDPMQLACRTRLDGDACFELPYAHASSASLPSRHRASLSGLERLGATTYRLELTLQDADGFAFEAGQYLRLRPPGLRQTRAYSMASAPAALPTLEFLIRRVDGGLMTAWLDEAAAPGDVLTLHGPLGAMGLDRRARRHLFVAGGTGLAPMLSMIRALPDDAAPALLCFGCSRREDLFHLDELRQLAETRPRLEVRVHCDAGGDPFVRSGNVLSSLTAGDLLPGTVAYLCGPPAMVDAARTRLLGAGLPAGAIRAERFAPSA